MPPQALAAVATLLSFAPQGNRIEFRLDHGAAEMVWLSPSTFRFRRTIEGPLPAVELAERPAVGVEIDDTPGSVRVMSRHLEVSVQKHGLLLRVRRPDGAALLADAAEPRASGSGFVWERQIPPDARFYGLGPRTDPTFDLRGKDISSETPFLFCTAGYAEYHPAAGRYRFDFTDPRRYRVEAPALDYYFHYGPGLKQVLEEHKDFRKAETWPAATADTGSWSTLHDSLLRLVHGAMSGMLAPTMALRPYEKQDAELVQRARQIGSLVDDVSPGPVGLSGLRKQLESFYQVYAVETRDRGFPLWHPLPFQFPSDPECANHTDEFMLGDEMLIAPIVQPGNQRTVYLPQGTWTNLETNEELPGRRNLPVETKSLPVFARNGTIIPLDSAAGVALHYFPKLPAEFFLLETEADGWTQVHASPAVDIMRLQIESVKARDYQWVVHHVARPTEVGFEGRKYAEVKPGAAMADRTWSYDAALKNLQVRVHVAAGENCIINLSFPQ